jgi:hypothetical protein
LTKSTILLENEKNIGSIPLHQKPVLTSHEEIFFDFHYYSWVIVQLYIKRTQGIKKYGKERFKELSEAKNSVRAKDRYFLHKFIPEEMFTGMEIQHFWGEDMVDTYEYCCIWTRNENQVIEKRKLEKMGWDVEGMVNGIEKVFRNGKQTDI